MCCDFSRRLFPILSTLKVRLLGHPSSVDVVPDLPWNHNFFFFFSDSNIYTPQSRRLMSGTEMTTCGQDPTRTVTEVRGHRFPGSPLCTPAEEKTHDRDQRIGVIGGEGNGQMYEGQDGLGGGSLRR